MSGPIVNVTQTYIVDGEVFKEDTFPITDTARITGLGCPPITIQGPGAAKLQVLFTFDPPLIVPEGGE